MSILTFYVWCRFGVDAMGGDMTAMSMKSDSAWKALSESVRRDLADLRALSGSTLERRIRVHVDRVRRLLSMHEAMMRAVMGDRDAENGR
jgi:hypothetical protein